MHFNCTCITKAALTRGVMIILIIMMIMIYRGWQKNIYTFQEMLSMYYFSKLNWITVAVCSRTFAQMMALVKWMLTSPYNRQNLPGQWIGRRGADEFPPCSPDLTPLDFCLWGTLKDVVYCRKPATLAVLWEEIEMACAAIHVDTLVSVAQAVVRRNQKCLDADGNHFEHLL